MKKTHTIRLSAEQYKLMLFSLGFSEGALRGTCQFEVADALTALIRKVRAQQTQDAPAVVKAAKAG